MSVSRMAPWIATVALIPSCASFSERPLHPSYAGPPEAVSLRISVSEDAKLQVGPDDWINTPLNGDLAETSANAIWNSGWVRQASEAQPAADLKVHVSTYRGPGPSLLSGATAFLLPDTVDHRLDLALELRDTSGESSGCARSAVTRTWYQTFLIFVYPFRSPAYGRMKTIEALALSCMAELLESRTAH